MKEADEILAELVLDIPIGSQLPLVIDGVAGRYRVTRMEVLPGYSSGPIHLQRMPE